MMEHDYQRLFGGLLGLFLVGPAVTILIARQLQLQPRAVSNSSSGASLARSLAR